MGVLTRKQGEAFVISSDRCSTDNPTQSAPKARLPERYEVWTGQSWSALLTDALTFATMDAADEYVRVNFEKVTGITSPPKKPSVRRPKPPPASAPDNRPEIG